MRTAAAHRETRTMAKTLLLYFGLALGAASLAAVGVAVDAGASPAAADSGETAVEPMRFETPDAAAMALIEAADTEGADALHSVLGDGLEDLVSGDPVADAGDRRSFVTLAREAAGIEGETDDSALLVIGPDDWPFPIPLARDAGGWYFDTAAGVEELLDRRIGLNELSAIATARAFVDAQLEYAAADPDGDGTHAYAGRFWSSEGKRDGLYWPSAPGEPESPMGPLVAEAVGEGYSIRDDDGGARPYHGYLFRLLDAQGAHAPGGTRSYVTDAGLTGGFGLLAWPASYGNSGIMSFVVNQRGIVYEADLGEDTDATAAAIDSYDPGDGWEPVTD
jgi:hypothetical protein